MRPGVSRSPSARVHPEDRYAVREEPGATDVVRDMLGFKPRGIIVEERADTAAAREVKIITVHCIWVLFDSGL